MFDFGWMNTDFTCEKLCNQRMLHFSYSGHRTAAGPCTAADSPQFLPTTIDIAAWRGQFGWHF
jgi:hypothetical protein